MPAFAGLIAIYCHSSTQNKQNCSDTSVSCLDIEKFTLGAARFGHGEIAGKKLGYDSPRFFIELIWYNYYMTHQYYIYIVISMTSLVFYENERTFHMQSIPSSCDHFIANDKTSCIGIGAKQIWPHTMLTKSSL